MKDYYNLLGIVNTDELDIKQLKKIYNTQISKFIGLPFLTKQMISDIKNIKEAFFVLSNNTMKQKYDKKLKLFNQLNNDTRHIDNTKICDRLFSVTFTNIR